MVINRKRNKIQKLCVLQKPFPADNLKKYNKNAKPNKDIFLYPMLRFYYISTNLQSHLSGNKLLYSKFAIKVKKIKMFDVTIVIALWEYLHNLQ